MALLDLANPVRFLSLSARILPWMAAAAAVTLAAGFYLAFRAPPDYQQGETVRIEEIAPLSKLKTWKVIERVNTHATPERASAEG